MKGNFFCSSLVSSLNSTQLFIGFNTEQAMRRPVAGLFSLFLQLLRKRIAKQVNDKSACFLCLLDPVEGFYFLRVKLYKCYRMFTPLLACEYPLLCTRTRFKGT